MKWFLIILAIYLVEANSKVSRLNSISKRLHQEPPAPVPVFRNNVSLKYIQQKLDHFDDSEKRTWQMRYFANDFYFKENGPIFIYVGGEWEISDGWVKGGHMFDMARSLNGYMFYTEHRYYGKSQPFANLQTNNLKYLDVKQALADLRHFIVTAKATIPGLQNSKVILVGASYAATMVTWFSKLYPNDVDGAWASSAPLLAKVDFKEYKEVVGSAIAQIGGQACYNRIENAIKTFESEVESGIMTTVRRYMSICTNFNTNNEMDVQSLFGTISNIFAGLVQYHWTGDIEWACDTIMSGSNDVDGLGNLLAYYLKLSGSQCYDFTYAGDVAYLKSTALSDDESRQWYYQTCNEFGWYQTSTSSEQPFGSKFPVEYYTSLCRDVYDMKFNAAVIDENVKLTNGVFGDMQPNVKNVYFTHGSIDPWSAMGIQCSGECGAVVPLHSHCGDLYSRSSSDTAEMAALKNTITALVNRWTS